MNREQLYYRGPRGRGGRWFPTWALGTPRKSRSLLAIFRISRDFVESVCLPAERQLALTSHTV